MRVTQHSNFSQALGQIHKSKSRMEKLHQQSATLRKLNTPSDDPVGSAKVLEVRTSKVNNDQFQENAKMAQAFLNNSDHALGEISEVILRAKEIALSQASGPSSSHESRLGVSEEVSQLFQRAVAAGNTRFGDRYLFGGYKTDQAPLDEKGHFQGDEGEMMVEISKGVFVSMNVPGLDAFNTSPETSADRMRLDGQQGDRKLATEEELKSRPGAGLGEENVNVFGELQNLRIALLTGNMEGIQGTLERLDELHAKVTSVRAKLGSRSVSLSSAIDSLDRQNLTNQELTSIIEDADMAKVMSDLAQEETVFRSVLSTSQRMIQPTLLDFLK